ncbi:MAG: 4-hydroxy-tetrahydrodipicolinate synthase [Anaerolineae bacterium]|mgnify:CR=1 FL=1|jgi:4-hydroxy-tetrahydrodipicolinate synthase|nr:MAG: 4-hydroxy-tetrahydrodipicolinate synthase [Anaerolineae bacterium]
MRNNLFRGVTTAMITPFNSDGTLDLEGLKNNTLFQIETGVQGLLPLGTTGESPTLTDSEKELVVRTVIETVRAQKSSIKIMVGVGTNDTRKTINNAKLAKEWGADALLIVTPYYNKPTQEGIFAHFKAISESVDLPIVVYNIKSRTGTNIETPTLEKLAQLSSIIAVKEASGDIAQVMDVLYQIPEIAVYSGDDNLTFPMICLGAQGVISVISNLFPSQIVQMVYAALNGDLETARRLHFKLLPIFKAAFIETNPAPIKYAMNRSGFAAGPVRLPLVDIRPQSRQIIDQVLDTLKKEGWESSVR